MTNQSFILYIVNVSNQIFFKSHWLITHGAVQMTELLLFFKGPVCKVQEFIK